MNLSQLLQISPKSQPIAGRYLEWLNRASLEFDITTPARLAYWLANVIKESAYLFAVEENLNYGVAGLRTTWPARFNDVDAVAYAKQPERIANRAYANRLGNSDEASGDGWRYRGAGLIQLTGRANMIACAAYFDMPLATVPGWLKTPEGACRSAGWFAKVNGLNAYADKGDFDGYCDKVNMGRKTLAVGDALGYSERLALRDAAIKVLTQGV